MHSPATANLQSSAPHRIYARAALCALLSLSGAAIAPGVWANDLPTEPTYQSERSANSTQGIAAYASYTNASYANAEAANLERVLGQSVQVSDVVVGGVKYLRLQSAPQSPIAARALVKQAQQAGYSSWFVTANSQSPSEAPAAAVMSNATVTTGSTLTSTPSKLLLTPDNPELALQLPEGPLLGELYPPRAPLPAR